MMTDFTIRFEWKISPRPDGVYVSEVQIIGPHDGFCVTYGPMDYETVPAFITERQRVITAGFASATAKLMDRVRAFADATK